MRYDVRSSKDTMEFFYNNVDKDAFIVRELDKRGLLAKYPSLRPHEILGSCGFTVQPCNCRVTDCAGWVLTEQPTADKAARQIA